MRPAGAAVRAHIEHRGHAHTGGKVACADIGQIACAAYRRLPWTLLWSSVQSAKPDGVLQTTQHHLPLVLQTAPPTATSSAGAQTVDVVLHGLQFRPALALVRACSVMCIQAGICWKLQAWLVSDGDVWLFPRRRCLALCHIRCGDCRLRAVVACTWPLSMKITLQS